MRRSNEIPYIESTPTKKIKKKIISKTYQSYIEFKNLKILPPIKITNLFFEILPSKFHKKYTLKKEIGRGGCGIVYLAQSNLTKKNFAIKKFYFNKENIDEIEIIKKLKHFNIITPIEYCIDNGFIFLVTEFLQGGTLYDRILKKKKFGEESCRNWIKQILKGLGYCHEMGVVHRDIKPENLLFFNEEKNNIKNNNLENDKENDFNDDNFLDNGIIKIIDFGVSTKFYKNKFLNHKCGSAYYVAPEVLKDRYNEKVDIWSLGVILYIMLSGKPPINGKNPMEILKKIYLLKKIDFSILENCVTFECLDFLKKMLTIDFEKRPSANDLLNSPWLVSKSKKKTNFKTYNKILKSLRNFQSHNYLQNIIYFYTTSKILEKEEKKKLSKIFSELDEDNDGILNYNELVKAFQKSGRSFERSSKLVTKILNELNLDPNEGIEFNHFLVTCNKKKNIINDENLKNAFLEWDLENKGFVSIEDIKEVLKNGYFGFGGDISSFEFLLDGFGFENGKMGFEEFKEVMQHFAEDEKMSQSLTFH